MLWSLTIFPCRKQQPTVSLPKSDGDVPQPKPVKLKKAKRAGGAGGEAPAEPSTRSGEQTMSLSFPGDGEDQDITREPQPDQLLNKDETLVREHLHDLEYGCGFFSLYDSHERTQLDSEPIWSLFSSADHRTEGNQTHQICCQNGSACV